MSDTERRLRETLAEGATHAPDAAGLLADVHHLVRRRRTRRVLVAAAVVVLGGGGVLLARATGFQASESGTVAAAGSPAPAKSLVGSWRPVSHAAADSAGKTAHQSVPSRPGLAVEFTPDGRWYTTDDPCSPTSGTYVTSPGDAFTATGIDGASPPGCGPDVGAAVTTATTYTVTGDVLTLFDSNHRVLAVYRRNP
ncbi:hypothetical protein V5P93_006062 [Actinokineospora auranticolor]|uniref:META domain-containing protein n=1 Tax=Actinokineospora auranticolor TaxID=155976 RepID=A0A2S6GG05_9PSEU|nr:hypothetical protein [Actinokineospora auranticolor]PPK64150.1 hypothetical protein CLV40_12114 [Actinokineospora auranticolor]